MATNIHIYALHRTLLPFSISCSKFIEHYAHSFEKTLYVNNYTRKYENDFIDLFLNNAVYELYRNSKQNHKPTD